MGSGPGSYPTSPWVVRFVDYQNNAITITVVFNETTHALISGNIVRDPGCLMATILLGVGPDGTPDSTTTQFRVPFGSNDFTPRQMAKAGFNTMDDFLSLQITAGL